MTSQQNNPWAARFAPLLDKALIKKRALVRVPKIEGIHEMTTESACAKLNKALETVFYPTTQCVDILHRFVDSAYAHCITTYADRQTFLSGVYSSKTPLAEFCFPILLTGLSGVGKSQLIKALSRIQNDDSDILVDAGHSPFPLRGPRCVTVLAKSNPLDILRTLSATNDTSTNLVANCRKLIFRDGIPFVMADEFQFATGSSSANSRVTQMLLLLGYLGIPWCYCANFSLVSRLLKRPEEDRQRLISDWAILQPDPPSSEDWINTLDIQRSVAPDILRFDPSKDGAALHAYSAGRKRAVAKLLVLALRSEHSRGGTVDINAIRRAYHSPGYASLREESAILATQAIKNLPDKRRKDLWCPLPTNNSTAEFTKASIEKRNELVARAELESSLNGEERKALREIERVAKKSNSKSGEIVPIRRKTVLTADELKKSADWFKGQL